MWIPRVSDAVLVQRAQDGDIAAFSCLVERYQNTIHGLAFHLVRNFADAEDLAQDTFIAAYKNIERVREPERVAGWLRSITYNQWRMRRRVSSDGLKVSIDDENYAHLLHELADPSPTPDVLILRDERLRGVMQAIASLPEITQLVTTLHYFHDLSCREIADLLDLSPSAIRSRLQRAREKLREEMIKMAKELFSEHRLTPDFVRRIIGHIHGFAFSGYDYGNLSKIFPDAKARELYLSLYPTGQYDAGAAQRLGYSEEEYTQILEMWEYTKIIKRQGNKLIAQIPIYIVEDVRRCSAWIDRVAATILRTIQARIGKYEEFAAELFRGNPMMHRNFIGILIIFYTLKGVVSALKDQYSLALEVPERLSIGSCTLAAYGENSEGKHLFNVGINGYPEKRSVLYLLHREGKVERELMWQFANDWLRREFPMVELLVNLGAIPQTSDAALQIAMELGFRKEFASIALDDLKTLGFLSPESPHRLLIPCLSVSGVERAESLAQRVAEEAVTAIGNPQTQLRTIIQECSFARCNFADVFNMLFLELRGTLIEQLIQRGMLMPLPSQANAEWGCWIEVRNDASY